MSKLELSSVGQCRCGEPLTKPESRFLRSRREVLGGILALGATSARAKDDDTLQRQIERRAVRIRVPATNDADMDDLEPLLAAIGNARIVMLGEPSHGAGTAFAAKARLVRLLHERLGFDVLAWESGLIDLERTEAGLAGDVDPVEAAQRGILKIWSASAECRPLFAYAKASHQGPRPLAMAGFDMQLTAAGTLDHFTTELHAFVSTLEPPQRRLQAQSLVQDMLTHFQRLNRYTEAIAAKASALSHAGLNGAEQDAALREWDQTEGDTLRPVAADLEGLEEAADPLLRLLGEGDGASGGTRRTGFMMRAIASLAGYGANLFESQGKHSPEEAAGYALTTENRRDRINADNLKWLVDQEYAGRRVLVWAHNAHVMNAWYTHGFDGVSLQPAANAMKPTGIWLADWYGHDVYRIGFTAWQGSDAWVGGPPTPIPTAPPGSLEERLHRLGAPQAFLPLRTRSGRAVLPAGAIAMRIPKYKVETVATPSQPYDAVYFIDTMQPATLV